MPQARQREEASRRGHRRRFLVGQALTASARCRRARSRGSWRRTPRLRLGPRYRRPRRRLGISVTAAPTSSTRPASSEAVRSCGRGRADTGEDTRAESVLVAVYALASSRAVNSRGVDSDQHLVLLRHRPFDVLESEHLRAPVPVVDHRSHPCPSWSGWGADGGWARPASSAPSSIELGGLSAGRARAELGARSGSPSRSPRGGACGSSRCRGARPRPPRRPPGARPR